MLYTSHVMNYQQQIEQTRKRLESLESLDPLQYTTYRRFIKASNLTQEIAGTFSGSTLGTQHESIFRKRQYFPLLRSLEARMDIWTGRSDVSKKDYEKAAALNPTVIRNNLQGLVKDQIKWLQKVEKEVRDRNIRSFGDVAFLEYLLERRNNPFSRRVIGNGLSLALVDLLVEFHKRGKLKVPKSDDISALRRNLIAKTTDKELKSFLRKRHSKFVIADQVRNGSVHWFEASPSRQDLLVILTLLKETRQFPTRRQ